MQDLNPEDHEHRREIERKDFKGRSQIEGLKQILTMFEGNHHKSDGIPKGHTPVFQDGLYDQHKNTHTSCMCMVVKQGVMTIGRRPIRLSLLSSLIVLDNLNDIITSGDTVIQSRFLGSSGSWRQTWLGSIRQAGQAWWSMNCRTHLKSSAHPAAQFGHFFSHSNPLQTTQQRLCTTRKRLPQQTQNGEHNGCTSQAHPKGDEPPRHRSHQ
ncbi:hypothetical protein EDD36DRAFT_139685 [Exophiala viscosa]|uniref:Uncharacterized protein n=1 Tax=Exophiala viscosa TaxID=2486360 RepID=A0AAN6IGE9_9EURO|nr:hypothetical protein EDD36DRAFT_139685 [Exophiala viscosa]